MTNPQEIESLHSALGEAERYAKELEARLAEREWRPIETAPRDGRLIDVSCIDFYEGEHRIRLTDVAWHEANDAFPHTGWIRVTDDGNYDLVEEPPFSPLGLPAWKITHWQPLPPPPST